MELYKFQKEILKASEGLSRVAYYLDMGLGKTFIGAEKMKQLNAPINLVVCQKSKIEDWKEHFKSYYDYELFDLTKSKEFNKFEEAVKTKTKHKITAIINYDILWRRDLDFILNSYNFTLMLDESSLIQNTQAERTSFVVRDLRPANVILLSGTPVGGKYENLYSQMYLLGYREKYMSFFAEYVKYKSIKAPNGYDVIIPTGYKDEEKLKTLLKSLGCFFMKTEEVIELPKQNFIDVKLRKPWGYEELLRKPLKKCEHAEFVRMIELRKLSGVNKEKETALLDLISSSQSRFIIFYCYDAELEIIKKVCKKLHRPTSVINGHEKDLSCYETKEDCITMVQYQAGAMGLNLQKANKIIFYSPTFRSELYEQAKKRIHRIGQEKTCFYYLLKAGFDFTVYKVLEKRKDYTNKLFTKEFKFKEET